MILTKGEIICITEGCYSDYGIIGHFKVLENKTEEELKDIAKEVGRETSEYNEQYENMTFEERIALVRSGVSLYKDHKSEFVATLVRHGIIEDVDVGEWHIGFYGDLEV